MRPIRDGTGRLEAGTSPRFTLIGVTSIILLSTGIGWWLGGRNAQDAERIRSARELSETNRAWLERFDAIKQEVTAAKLAASAAAAEANAMRTARQAIPALKPTATASDSTAYWKTRALAAESEAESWKTAWEAEKKATAALTPAADSSSRLLATTDTTLTRALGANKSLTHINLLGMWVPKPPKLVTLALGCGVGALIDTKNVARGCGVGGLVGVLALPSR